MIKGAEALIVICAIIWIFWMTKTWLTKGKKKETKTKE